MTQGPISPIGGTFAPIPLCPNIKITIRPPHGNPYLDYQLADGTRVQGEPQPPCVSLAGVSTGESG